MVDGVPQSIAEIPCVVGENILLLIEDYFNSNDIDIEFDELIPL